MYSDDIFPPRSWSELKKEFKYVSDLNKLKQGERQMAVTFNNKKKADLTQLRKAQGPAQQVLGIPNMQSLAPEAMKTIEKPEVIDAPTSIITHPAPTAEELAAAHNHQEVVEVRPSDEQLEAAEQAAMEKIED